MKALEESGQERWQESREESRQESRQARRPERPQESRRQAALLAAIDRKPIELGSLRFHEPADRAALGLAVYRGQADATAAKALASIFPTLAMMLGAADFERFAGEFRRSAWPLRGDLGEWGTELPAFVESHPGLKAWPWLADSARLDLAVHRNERAADGVFDAGSMALLASTDPALLRLEPMPGSALLRSVWPIVAIHAAHRIDAGRNEPAFEAVAAAITERRGEIAWVVRRGWRADVIPVEPADVAWMQSLLAGEPLATALHRAGADFRFSRWLAEAVAGKRLQGVVLRSR